MITFSGKNFLEAAKTTRALSMYVRWFGRGRNQTLKPDLVLQYSTFVEIAIFQTASMSVASKMSSPQI
jgi:hypothetical protein